MNVKIFAVLGSVGIVFLLTSFSIFFVLGRQLGDLEKSWDEEDFMEIDQHSSRLIVTDIGPGILEVHSWDTSPIVKDPYTGIEYDPSHFVTVTIDVFILESGGIKNKVDRAFFKFDLEKRGDYEIRITTTGSLSKIRSEVEYEADNRDIIISSVFCIAPIILFISILLISTSIIIICIKTYRKNEEDMYSNIDRNYYTDQYYKDRWKKI